MARKPSKNDFQVLVDGVGTFTFAYRTMQDEIRIQQEYANVIGGVPPTAWLAALGEWLSVFRVLTVQAPDSWVLEEMDPLDDNTYKNMSKVYEALRAKEDDFRGRSRKGGQGESPVNGHQDPLLGEEEVQPAAE